MKIRNSLALLSMAMVPLVPLQAADAESLRPTVARILERHGIAGNPAQERKAGNAESHVRQSITAAQSTAASMPVIDAAAVPPSVQVEPGTEAAGPEVAGLIVRFSDEGAAERAMDSQTPPREAIEALHAASWLPLEFVRPMSLGRFVFQFSEPASQAEYEELAAELMRLPEIESVSPDTVASPQLWSGDPDFFRQWSLLQTGSYSDTLDSAVVGIDAVRAWDLVGVTSPVTVAVVDSGITNPPAIEAARLLPGFDFISDPLNARDGDGWDSNPLDEGNHRDANECDNYPDARNSTWHGTKMLSIIAARGDDGRDIAGIDWNARVVPVRVLGKCGGTVSDIVDGMLWAAGYPVPGTPANNFPARIINMSLGGIRQQGCNSLYRDAFDELTARGVLIVASAGNDNREAAHQQPGNCMGAVTVGAVDHLGDRASYSNWSEVGVVNISAPAGDGTVHGPDGGLMAVGDGGDTQPTGNLTTYWTSGTSGAAALVSGSLSLALSLDPQQHPDLLVSILYETAQPFKSGSECALNYQRCGVGILDLEAMIQGTLVFKDHAVVRDFYHPGLKHYFRTATWEEVSQLQQGTFGDWQEQGDMFLAWRDGSVPGTYPVCRFYGTPGIGPNSHFYTVDQSECEHIRQNDPGWTYEGTAFYAMQANNQGGCPYGTKPLYRYYNQLAQENDSNHRYSTTLNDRAEMEARGWVMEGVAMCVKG